MTEERRTLEMNVYVSGVKIDAGGLNENEEERYVLEGEGAIFFSNSGIEDFMDYVLINLRHNVNPKYFDKVRIDFPDKQKGRMLVGDGFFGRPLAFLGAEQLKPLGEKDRKTLKDKIKSQGAFEVKGKRIEIISE